MKVFIVVYGHNYGLGVEVIVAESLKRAKELVVTTNDYEIDEVNTTRENFFKITKS